MTTHERRAHATHGGPPSPALTPAEQTREASREAMRETVRSVTAEAERAGEQLKGSANVVKEQAQVAYRSIREELRFIKAKFAGTSLRDHAIQLASTWLIVTAMHFVMNTMSHQMPFSFKMLQMYIEHWQPLSFVIALAVLSRALDHLPGSQQYAWATVALCMSTAALGWVDFPFSGILEKAAVSLPMNARNFVWMACLPPAVNFVAKKIKQQ